MPEENVDEVEAALRAAIGDHTSKRLAESQRRRWLKQFLERFPYTCPHCGSRLFGEWQGRVLPGIEDL